MSAMITQLLAEDPSVVLIAEDSILRSQFIKKLQDKNLKVIILDRETLLKPHFDFSIFNDVYKVIWVTSSLVDKQEYLNILTVLKEVKTSLVVVMKIFTAITNSESNLLLDWVKASKQQEQFIIDCSYHLSQASFIFGQEVVVPSISGTSLEFCFRDISKGIIVKPSEKISYLDLRLFINRTFKYLFQPSKVGSILIKGGSSKERIEDLIKRVYNTHNSCNLEIVTSKVKVTPSTPFRVKEVYEDYSPRDIATKVVRQLARPDKEENIVKLKQPENVVKNVVEDEDNKTRRFSFDLANKLNNSKSNSEDLLAEKKVLSNVDDEKRIINNVGSENRVENIDSEKQSLSQEKIDESIKAVNKSVKTNDIPVSVDDEIERIFGKTRVSEKTKRIRKIVVSTKKQTKKTKRRTKFFKIGVGVSVIALVSLFFFIIFVSSSKLLEKQVVKNMNSSFLELEEKGNFLGSLVTLQTNLYASIFDSVALNKVEMIAKVNNEVRQTVNMLLEVNEGTQKQVLSIFSANDEDINILIQNQALKVNKLYEKLSSIQALLKQVEFNVKDIDQNKVVNEFEDKINEIRQKQAVYLQLQPILPSLLGVEDKKTYAVLLQNNQELRATGGFIQAIALLTFEDGKLISTSVQSVYELDKKIRGQVEAPEEVSKYLGEKSWYLRDSNWSPDFPTTAKQVSWFISKATGRDIDGVIGINLYTLKDILSVVGPIELSEFNEVISEKNIFERMEFHSEVILVDSSNSLDYSTVVLQEILRKIQKVDEKQVIPLLDVLEDEVNEKQLLFSVFNKEDEEVLNNLGWNGSLSKPSCPAKLSVKDCLVDSIFQVETNVGVNKANYYLEKETKHKVELDGKSAKHSRIIKYKNNARSNSWPKGTYHSYQRFYINDTSRLDYISIDGVTLTEDLIEITKLKGFTQVGFILDIPIQKEVNLEFHYSTPLNFNSSFSYVLFNQKQSGTPKDDVSVEFAYNPLLTPVLIAPLAEVEDNIIRFDNNNSS